MGQGKSEGELSLLPSLSLSRVLRMLSGHHPFRVTRPARSLPPSSRRLLYPLVSCPPPTGREPRYRGWRLNVIRFLISRRVTHPLNSKLILEDHHAGDHPKLKRTELWVAFLIVRTKYNDCDESRGDFSQFDVVVLMEEGANPSSCAAPACF